jgi:formylglycine-generating enzyme required for sulfatase activity
MGTDDDIGFPQDGEGPVRQSTVGPFEISPYAVSNADFARFVDASGYITDAEQSGWSFVFQLLLPHGQPAKRAPVAAPWWRQVYGASWDRPYGPGSDLEELESHPVVHVSWNDASAFCRWAKARLPSEAEWEYAARGGLVQKRYPWGNEFAPAGLTMCNIFEGSFPDHNTARDGYVGTAPVDAFPPNAFGLHNMVGNVWEWCSDRFSISHDSDQFAFGPPDGSKRAMRGGSYLCHDSYCNRYRVSARSSNRPDSSSGNQGFRIACDLSLD